MLKKPIILKHDDVSMNVDRHIVTVANREKHLTRKEFEVLRLMLEARGNVVSRDLVLDRVWPNDIDARVQSRTVDQHFSRLRKKIGAKRVETVSGYGYRLS